jgi:hypothetical protein
MVLLPGKLGSSPTAGGLAVAGTIVVALPGDMFEGSVGNGDPTFIPGVLG